MRLPHHGGRGSMELKLTPMIDVVFLLLVFFLWTSSFEQPEFDLPTAVAEPPAGLRDPDEAPPPPEAFDEIVITVRAAEGGAEGTVVLGLNGSEVPDVETLRARLTEIVSLGVQPPVIVDPEPQTPIGLAIDVYDIAREAGLDQVLFAANE